MKRVVVILLVMALLPLTALAEMWICGNCREYVAGDLRFCTRCGCSRDGRSFNDGRWVCSCGNINDGDLDYCEECGTLREGGKVGADSGLPGAATEALQDARAGDVVTFGQYPQTAPGTDMTPIEWIVLARNGDELVLLSKYALDCRPYDAGGASTSWETSTIRKWLNTEFYQKAFSQDEQAAIAVTNNENRNNPAYGTDGGKSTKDRVYMLSLDEVSQYFPLIEMPHVKWCFGVSEALLAAPTEYAKTAGALTGRLTQDNLKAVKDETGVQYPESLLGMKTCWWWLRTPGSSGDSAAFVNIYGYVFSSGRSVGDSIPVRPAVTVKAPSGRTGGKKVWYCSSGHACAGAVCEACGEEWTSGSAWICGCGEENCDLFCQNCGQRRPLYGFLYTCECGQDVLLTNGFCENCGRRNPAKLRDQNSDPAAEAPVWYCENGHACSGEKCDVCGEKWTGKSAWICGCGEENRDLFCQNCGQRRPLYGFLYTCECGQDNLLTNDFCEECGRRNPALGWTCEKCGSANENSDLYCVGCGSRRP